MKSEKDFNRYDSISNLPAFRWDQINGTGDLRYLLVTKKPLEVETENQEDLKALWLLIQQEYLDEFGMTDFYKELIDKKKKEALYRLKYLINSDGSQNALAKIKSEEIKEMTDSAEKVNFNKLIAKVEKFMGYSIDGETISVLKLHTYLRLMNEKGNG